MQKNLKYDERVDNIGLVTVVALYAVPLDHSDKKEYLRIRQDVESVRRKGIVVGYELPDINLTRHLLGEVLGKSQKGLEDTVISFLNSIGTRESFLENLTCNLMELDRAKRTGLVARIVPIDLPHGLSNSPGARDTHFIERYEHEAQLGEMLYDAITTNAPFRRVVQVLKADLLANNDAWKLRNMEMKKNIFRLMSPGGDYDVVAMMGAEHLPWIARNLRRDHVEMKELEDPREVAGVWWTNYTATEEAKRLKDTNMAGIELARLAVMLSMRVLRAQRGGSELTEKEVAIAKGITDPKGAEAEYKKAQEFYRDGFAEAIPLLVVKRN